jgi:4-hydroxy-tetrahydrodipicolinate synthase
MEAIDVAARAGADAALVPPPFYDPLSDAALVSFYESIARTSPIPVVLYHIPVRTKNRLSLAAVRELAAFDRIVGIKDSDGQARFHLELLDLQRPEFAVFQGDASMAGWSYLHGAAGAITPVSSLYPDLEVDLRRAAASGDLVGVRARSAEMAQVARLLRLAGIPLVTNLKAIGELLGIMQRWTEPPMPVASDDHLADLRAAILACGPWASSALPQAALA